MEILIRNVVAGATAGDAVQLHGAVVATLERYPPRLAAMVVFEPALAQLETAAARRAEAAIEQHANGK